MTTRPPLLFIAMALTLGSVAVQAQVPTPFEHFEGRIDMRQAKQQQRIGAGVADGSLTGREAARLQRQQFALARHERRIEADGHITRGEAHGMERHMDRTSRHIYTQRHDRQRRSGS